MINDSDSFLEALMMENTKNEVIKARLSIQRALLGAVSRPLRAVIFSIHSEGLDIRFYFDGEAGDADVEAVSCVESEVMADYEPGGAIEGRCIRLDAPEPILDDGVWVYLRSESASA